MKRFLPLLLLAAAGLPAGADDTESRRAEAAKLIAKAWALRDGSGGPELEVSRRLTELLTALYPKLLNPACYEYRAPKDTPVGTFLGAMKTLRNRLSGWGVKGAVVVSHGDGRILVLLNEEDEKKLGEDLECVAWPGVIQFRLEADEKAREEWKETGKAPAGTRVFSMSGSIEKFLASEEKTIDARRFNSAARRLADGRLEIALTLTDEGGKEMEELTGKNLDRRLGMIAGTQVLSAPVIKSRIGREVSITGNFTGAEMDRIIGAFNGGPMPCELAAGAVESGIILKEGEKPWVEEPVKDFVRRLVESNLVHAILEEILKGREDATYIEILKALK